MFGRLPDLSTTAAPSRRPRPSLLRLSLSRIAAQRNLKPPRRKGRWFWKCLRQALSTKVVLLLLGLLLFRILSHHAATLLSLFRDPNEPTTFFKTYRIHKKEIVIRPWRKPLIFTPFADDTKRFVRLQPILELQRAPRPSAYHCDPGEDVPLAFIGVFSTASRWSRRMLLREYEIPAGGLVNGRRIEVRFILGRPKRESEMESLQIEMEKYGDIVLLDEEENMNDGKTYMFYQWLAKRPGPKPQFAFKADDDTLMVLPNLVELLSKLNCNYLYYLGSCIHETCGLNRGFPYYFTGMAYGLSAPLYQWIGNANLPRSKIRGMEDVRTAKYLLNLNERKGENLIRLNLDGRMGDWRYSDGPEWNFDPKTVLALHGMKKESTLKKIKQKLVQYNIVATQRV